MQAGIGRRWLNHTCGYTLRRRLVLAYRGSPISKNLHEFAKTDNDVKLLRRRTRNIGIIAHIDAGKTTTTERMLYYSGYTRRIGDVDDGSTVTDFLPAERARGITIQSAAITFHWPPLQTGSSVHSSSQGKQSGPPSMYAPSHTINLIDTPGHADFTFEVLRSLRILDGAVCILDGVAGVEAQTEKVWYQAATYKIPKLIYVNKLDRDGAAFGKTVKEIASKLHAWPAVCQIPWFEGGNGRFIGVVDVVSLQALRWAEGGDGKTIKVFGLTELEAQEPSLVREARKARTALVELLSEYDDVMVEKYLECEEDHMAITEADITASLRRCVLSDTTTLVPVYAGASFRNIGVQPLLDTVVDLLPSPEECPDPEIRMGKTTGSLNELVAGKMVLTDLEKLPKAKRGGSAKKSGHLAIQNLETCALAFKVLNDSKRGVLVYVRVYHGAVHRNALLFNTNLQVSERAPRLLEMYASDAVEVSSISAGQIGVIVGLKYARTGDTLVSYTGANPKTGPPAPLNSLQLRPIDVPPPVFFASVEPQSLSEEKPVADALALLLREDPSLRLSVDEDSGQTLLSGMGELHLEIARDRLIQDLKAKATMGKIEIGYRECILAPGGPKTVLFDRETAGRKGKAGCTATVSPLIEDEVATGMADEHSRLQQDGNLISISILQHRDDADESNPIPTALPTHLSDTIIHTALRNGALAALARGPQYSFALHSTHLSLTIDPSTQIFGTDTTAAALSSVARLAIQAALKASTHQTPTSIMEPVMNVTIGVDEKSLGAVVHDLSSARGGHILSLDDADTISSSSNDNHTSEDLPLIDICRVYAPPDPFGVATVAGDDFGMASNANRARTITARVPLKEMVGYLKYLRSLTEGRGTFVMSVDRFERMSGVREKQVLKEMRGL